MQTTAQLSSNNITSSRVCWGTVLGGAFAAAGLSILFLELGAGLGLAVISPLSNTGINAATFGVSVIIWLMLTQIAAASLGGYFAGRTRENWAAPGSGEIAFLDAAHGFLAWSVTTLGIAVLAGTVTGKILSAGMSTAADATLHLTDNAVTVIADAIDVNAEGNDSDSSDKTIHYMVDSLFRSDHHMSDTTQNSSFAMRMEVARILLNGIRYHDLPAQDRQYLAQLVSKHTDLSLGDAEKRVGEVFDAVDAAAANAQEGARKSAEKARKAVAYGSLWMGIALFFGAIAASFFAALGGRRRDSIAHRNALR